MSREILVPLLEDPKDIGKIHKSQCKQAHQCRNWDLVEPAGQERSDDSSSDHDSVSTLLLLLGRAGAEIMSRGRYYYVFIFMTARSLLFC